MAGIWGSHPGWGLTAVRVAMAIILIVAGYQKWVSGIGGTSAYFAKVGIPLAGVMGPFIGLLELGGGLLLLVGLFARWLGLLYAIEFTVAAFYVKFPAGFAGGRLDLMLLAGGLLFLLAGPGRAAIDEVWLEKDRRAERRA